MFAEVTEAINLLDVELVKRYFFQCCQYAVIMFGPLHVFEQFIAFVSRQKQYVETPQIHSIASKGYLANQLLRDSCHVKLWFKGSLKIDGIGR